MGSQANTGEIWRQLHDRLLSYVRGRVSTSQDAEDILQDVFVRIHANLDDMNEVQNITAWVYRITRNAITDYYRQRARAGGAVQVPAEMMAHMSSHDDDRQPGSGSQAGQELAGCIEPLVERLPEAYRRALTLTELGGLTQREAAEQLGLSLSGMKSRVARGRSQLRELLLGCCNIELDRRGAVIDFERREGACGSCDCE